MVDDNDDERVHAKHACFIHLNREFLFIYEAVADAGSES